MSVDFDPADIMDWWAEAKEEEEQKAANQPLVYGKPVIRKIKLTAAKQLELNKLLSQRNMSSKRLALIRKWTGGGACHGCNGIPTWKVTYDVKGAKLVEWYCDECFKKATFD